MRRLYPNSWDRCGLVKQGRVFSDEQVIALEGLSKA